MSQRKIVLLLALAVAVAAPATASAAPTVTVTGDDGNPARSAASALRPPQHGRDGHRRRPGHRHRQLHRPGLRPRQRGRHAAQPVPAIRSSRRRPGASPTTAATAPTPSSCATYAEADTTCTGTATERRYQYVINAGSAVTAPPAKLLTRAPNSFATNTHQLGVTPQPRRVHLRGPLRARRRHRARRRDLRPVGRDVRQHRQRPRRLPLRQAGPLRDRGAREAQHLLRRRGAPAPSSTRSRRSTSSA